MIHLLECTEESSPFVGSAVIRAMNKLGREINSEELKRAKTMYFNKLLQNETSGLICQNNANQVRCYKKKFSKAELGSKVIELSSTDLVSSISD